MRVRRGSEFLSRSFRILWMTAAIFGLVGVVVGAVLSGLTQWWLEARRERHRFGVARRIVGAEMHNLSTQLDQIAQVAAVPARQTQGSDRLLPSTAWDTHRDSLATHLNDSDWWRTAMFYDSVWHLRRRLSESAPLSDLAPDELRTVRGLATAVANLLPTFGAPPAAMRPPEIS
jgi:hypothetical protein